MNLSKTKEEEKWKIESDVRTIREYAEISKDTKRMSAAKKMIEEEEKNTKDILTAGIWDKIRKIQK